MEREPHRIRPEQGTEAVLDPVRGEEDQHHDGTRDREQRRVAQPEDRGAAQQQVPHRAAAEPVTAAMSTKPTASSCLREATSAPEAAKTAMPARSSQRSRVSKPLTQGVFPCRYSAGTTSARAATALSLALPAQSSDRPSSPATTGSTSPGWP